LTAVTSPQGEACEQVVPDPVGVAKRWAAEAAAGAAAATKLAASTTPMIRPPLTGADHGMPAPAEQTGGRAPIQQPYERPALVVNRREQRLGHGSLLPCSICEHVDSEL
jgi:hypothetical protein